MAVGKYYGHHPSEDIVDAADYYKKTEVYTKTEVETYADAASANAETQAHEHYNGLWDDIRVAIGSFKEAAPGAEPTYTTFIGNLNAPFFANDATNTVAFSVQIPHGYKLGTDLEPHVHWTPPTSAAGYVVWSLEYVLAEVNGIFPGSTTTLQVTAATDGVAYKHQVDELGTIDGSAIDSISTMLICNLSRIGGNAGDTYGEDVPLLEVDFHYQLDELGSELEYSKYIEL